MKNKLSTLSGQITLWLIVSASFSIALSTAFMSIATTLMIIAWFLSGNFKNKFNRILNNTGAMSACFLFIFYVFGAIYSNANNQDSIGFLLKYQKLLLIPLIVSVLVDDKFRTYALNAFLIGMMFVLILSYLMWLNIIPHHADMSQGYYVFKGRIAHNIFMSFAMYFMLHKAYKSNGSHRYFWILFSFLSAMNITYLVNGRTGQITMILLAVWFIYETWGIKKTVYCIALITLSICLLVITNKMPHSRLSDVKQEAGRGSETSAGQRLEMYKNTLTLISKHPLFGGGTGSLKDEYKSLALNKKLTLTYVTNPHNQFLLTSQEIGIFGLAALIYMWITHWNASYKLTKNTNYSLLRGLVLTITVGSLFNSLLLDAGEGKFYCVLAGVLLSSVPTKRNII
jgi:O-antigen ligase